MPNLNFVSAGASARDAIIEEVMRRALLDRQAALDAQAKTEGDAAIRQRDEDLAFRREQEARIAKISQAQIDDLANEREFRRASTIESTAMPGDAVNADTEALMARQGFGGAMRKIPGVLVQGPLESTTDQTNPVARADELGGDGPEQTVMRGGARYLNAQAQRDAQAAMADENRLFREQQAAKDRDLKEFIAKAQLEIQRGTMNTQQMMAGLNAVIAQGRIQDQQDKRAATQAAAQNVVEGERKWATGLLAELDRLQSKSTDPKGQPVYDLNDRARAVTGRARVPEWAANMGLMGGADELAAIKSIASKLAVNTLDELKKQSKTGATGFGALSAPELDLLMNAEQALTRAQSEGRFNERLNEIRAIADKVLAFKGSDSATAPPAGGGADERDMLLDELLGGR